MRTKTRKLRGAAALSDADKEALEATGLYQLYEGGPILSDFHPIMNGIKDYLPDAKPRDLTYLDKAPNHLIPIVSKTRDPTPFVPYGHIESKGGWSIYRVRYELTETKKITLAGDQVDLKLKKAPGQPDDRPSEDEKPKENDTVVAFLREEHADKWPNGTYPFLLGTVVSFALESNGEYTLVIKTPKEYNGLRPWGVMDDGKKGQFVINKDHFYIIVVNHAKMKHWKTNLPTIFLEQMFEAQHRFLENNERAFGRKRNKPKPKTPKRKPTKRKGKKK